MLTDDEVDDNQIGGFDLIREDNLFPEQRLHLYPHRTCRLVLPMMSTSKSLPRDDSRICFQQMAYPMPEVVLPSVRVTQDIDFLQAGSPEEPVVYDDGMLGASIPPPSRP